LPASKSTPKADEPVEETPAAEPQTAPEVVPDAADANQWEFVNRIPTKVEVVNLLKTLPSWWGLRPEDYVDYVQPLPQNKKLQIEQEKDGRKFKVATFVEVFSLYFSVPGRQAMMRDAQERWGWQVEYTPVVATPSGVDGYLEFGERLVFRVEIEVRAPHLRTTGEGSAGKTGWLFRGDAQLHDAAPQYSVLGKRYGTAWVPREGGKAAAGSNPYEKVETSALGRALGAWGFGVLPGSGLASLEEMLGIQQNRTALEGERAIGAGTGPAADDRDNTPEGLRSSILQLSEQIAQATGVPDEQSLVRLAEFCQNRLQVDIVVERDAAQNPTKVDLTLLNHGKLVLVRNAMAKKMATIAAAQET
jgi:hypothetical protein